MERIYENSEYVIEVDPEREFMYIYWKTTDSKDGEGTMIMCKLHFLEDMFDLIKSLIRKQVKSFKL